MIDHDVHLAAIAAGDTDAFALWVAAADPRVRGSLAQFAAAVDTEAVMQECMLRVWQVAPRFKRDGRPDGLIRIGVRIARNLALTELRRRRPEQADQNLFDQIGRDDDAPQEPDPRLHESITHCLERLPPKPRAAIEARLRGAGQRDTRLAESVRMTINTFLQNIRRARLALADCLMSQGISLENRS